MATEMHRGESKPRRGSTVTTDHETIRAWAEQRAGLPVHATAGCRPDDPNVIGIRLNHADRAARVEPIQWREWFDRFDELRLAFAFRETTPSGKPSWFNKLVPRQD